MENKNVTLEKRKFTRFDKRLPVTLQIEGGPEKRAICRNISEGGAFIEIENDRLNGDIPVLCYKWAKIRVRIYFSDATDNTMETLAEPRWFKQISANNRYGLGVEFIGIDGLSKNRISSYFSKEPSVENPLDAIKNFPLLINGQEVDTGKYRYFPYIEKVILEPEITNFMLKEVKEGRSPAEYGNYIFGRYCIANSDLNHQAIAAAYNASKIYRKFHIGARVKILNDIHNLLEEKKDEFTKLLCIEGHPARLVEWEISGMLKGTDEKTLNFYREDIEKYIGRDNDESLSFVRRPDGVVCLLTPKNASSSISVIGVFALLAGNAIIIKPPMSVPLSTIYFWKEIVYKALRKNNAPAGTVNIIIGNSHNLMEDWIKSPLINSIIYIGDSRKGIEIGKKIYNAGKKPILELSGNDIMIIWKDASIEKASNSLLNSFLGSTQICMVPKLAVIHESIYKKFKNVFIEKVKLLKPGLPSDSETYLSPVGKIKDFFNVMEDAVEKKAVPLCGGNRVNWKGEYDLKGLFIQPTVLEIRVDNLYARDMLCIKNEIFFPLLPLIVVSGPSDENIWDQIVAFTNSHNYGLRVSVWTQSSKCARRFAEEIYNCGILRINSGHIGFSLYLANNGGINKSGGPFGEMNYIWQKTAHLQGISISPPS